MSMWRRKKHRERETVPETAMEALRRKIGLWAIPMRILYGAAHRIAFGFSLLISTMIGRLVGGVATGALLLDAGFGSDPVALPVSIPVVLLGALVFGYVAWVRRMRLEEHITAVLHDAIPGHSGQTPVAVWFPPRFGRIQLGRWLGKFEFGFRIPAKMTRSQEAEVSEHLRSRVPMHEGTSLAISWDWSRGTARAKLVEDLPGKGAGPLRVPEPAFEPPADSGAPDGLPYEMTREAERAATLIPIGVSREGEIVWDVEDYVALIVAGFPKGGKSALVRGLIAWALRHPAHYRWVGVDMKRVEYGPIKRRYTHRTRVVRDVATDLDAAERLMEAAHEEMMRRTDVIEAEDLQNISELNELRRERGEPPMPRLLVCLDEVAELVQASGGEPKEVRQKKERCYMLQDSLVRLGRAPGVITVLATQRPDAQFISGSTKSNTHVRAVMGNMSAAGSEMTLESTVASSLPGVPGRGIWYESGKLTEFSAYYTTMEDLGEIVAATEAEDLERRGA